MAGAGKYKLGPGPVNTNWSRGPEPGPGAGKHKYPYINKEQVFLLGNEDLYSIYIFQIKSISFVS